MAIGWSHADDATVRPFFMSRVVSTGAPGCGSKKYCGLRRYMLAILVGANVWPEDCAGVLGSFILLPSCGCHFMITAVTF